MADRRPWWRRQLANSPSSGGGQPDHPLVTDLQAHARDRHADAVLASAEATLGTTRTKLTSTSRTLASTGPTRISAPCCPPTPTPGPSGRRRSEAGRRHPGRLLPGPRHRELQTCLGGVKGALAQIANDNNTQAGMDLSGVSPSCETVDGGSTDGLAYPFDFPDPFVLTVGGTYFAYATDFCTRKHSDHPVH